MTDTVGIGDILLNEESYRIDITSWREKDIIDFAPRATVPTGSVVMSDLNLYQPLVQTDWRHGQGFHWYDDAAGYLSTTGNVDTRQDGLVMLYTTSASLDTDAVVRRGMTSFNGDVYVWGSDGLTKCTSGTATSVYSSYAVNFAFSAGDYLFFCPDGQRIQKMNKAGVISDAGLDSNSKDYKWMAVHNGFLYAGKDGNNHIHYDTNEDLSQLEGTTADPGIIYCGMSNKKTLGAIVFAAQLYVARTDGLWCIGDDHIARRVIDYSNEESDTNFRGMTVLNGYLVYALRDRVIQWNGSRVSDITPEKITDIYPYMTYGEFKHFIAADNFLYCVGKTNETIPTFELLCYDGVGWHKMTTFSSGAASADVYMLGYDIDNNRLMYQVFDGTDYDLRYIKLSDRSSFPYPSFPTTGTHSVISSRLDMGFRRVKKSMASLIVEARNCSATSYLSVYYQLDGSGTWVKWADIKQSGIQEIKSPGGFRTREFYYVNLRFDFTTSSASTSPILEGWTLRFIMRPDTLLGFNFTILASSNLQSGVAEGEMTAEEIRDKLLVVRNSKAPVRLVGVEGDEHWGYMTSFQGTPVFRRYLNEEVPDEIEWRFVVNFVEVG